MRKLAVSLDDFPKILRDQNIYAKKLKKKKRRRKKEKRKRRWGICGMD